MQEQDYYEYRMKYTEDDYGYEIYDTQDCNQHDQLLRTR